MTQVNGANRALALALSRSGEAYPSVADLTAANTHKTQSKLCGVSVTPNFTENIPTFNKIGCGGATGAGFGTTAQVGSREYRYTIAGDIGFNNGFDRILAQFLGNDTNTEVTTGQEDHKHVLTFASPINQRHLTLAYQETDTEIIEVSGGLVESISITTNLDGNPAQFTASVVFNALTLIAADQVNNLAALQAVDSVDEERLIAQCQHTFDIREDDGTTAGTAFLAGDMRFLQNYTLTLTRSLAVEQEMTGGACPAPSNQDGITGTVTFNFKSYANLQFVKDWAEGKTYKARLTHFGSKIGTGANKALQIMLPKVAFNASPISSIDTDGVVPQVLNMNILESQVQLAEFASTAPQFNITNKRVEDYI